jgi:hypothetical protein
LAIFNALWDVLSPHQNDALYYGLSLLKLHTGEDGNQLLRHHYIVALQLEFQLFPIQDPTIVAQFLAMLKELGADAIAKLLQMIHPMIFVMPKNHRQDFAGQNNGMDFDIALAHNISSTSGSNSTSTETDTSQSNVDA